MFYSLLDLLVCPGCSGELTLLFPEEVPATTSMRLRRANRLGPAQAAVGPLPSRPADTPLYRLLSLQAARPVSEDRQSRVHVVEGVLACVYCERWYPIREGLAELLPDHLRRWDDDRRWLETRAESFETTSLELVNLMLAHTKPDSLPIEDDGAHYKNAEMAIGQRSVRDGFFGPAKVAPFNPFRPEFTLDQLLRFGTTVSRLDCGIRGTVLDLGIAYGWTTEWLVRMGYEAIGIDITREYVLAGLPRMGDHRPHLIICDVENLPLRDDCVDAVLAFDAFHHFPNRNQVMKRLSFIMRPGAKMAMVEPGKEHEHVPHSIAIMEEHGILERGFDEADLQSYIEGTELGGIIHYQTDAHPHDMFTVQRSGELQPDSLAPRRLLAELIVEPEEGSVRVGSPPTLTVSIFNRGDTVWLSSTEDQEGVVRLGAMLYDSEHHLVAQDYARVSLPRKILPTEGVRLFFSLPALTKPGNYIVELDMVDEGYLWFKDHAYQPVNWPLVVEGEARVDEPPFVSDGHLPVIEPKELHPLPHDACGVVERANVDATVSAGDAEPKTISVRLARLVKRSRDVLRVQGPMAFMRAVGSYLRRKLL